MNMSKSALLFFSLGIAIPALAADCIYLKPLAADETREVQDGSSWATAYAEPSVAIDAAVTARKPVHAAQGVYIIRATIEMPSAGVTIYGGFAGVDDAETVEERDWDAHQTIFSGDMNRTVDVWRHVEPRLTQYAAATETQTDMPLVVDGKVNLPAYTGDYDLYVMQDNDGNTGRCFNFGNGTSGTIDGIWVVGFRNQNGAGIQFQKCGASTVRNCRFVGIRTANGVLYDDGGNTRSSPIVVSNCKFINNYTDQRGAGTMFRYAASVVDCEFVGGTAKDANVNGGLCIYQWTGANQNFTRCSIARHYGRQNTGWLESTYGGGGVILASEGGSGVFRDCVMSNNLSISCCAVTGTNAGGTPLLNARTTDFVNCRLVNNRQEIKVQAGYSYASFRGSAGSSGKQNFERCVFDSNVVYTAVDAASEPGEYAVGIVGNYPSYGQCFSLVNCAFRDNEVIAAETETVKAVPCRGVVAMSMNANIQPGFALANCTFSGNAAAGVYDVVQLGNTHDKALNIVNCLFESAADTDYTPFRFDNPGKVALYSVSAKNVPFLPVGVTAEDYQTDEVPLSSSFRPQAAPPGIRETADVASNAVNTAIGAQYSFRRRGATAWQALNPAWSTSVASAGGLIADLEGNARSEGGFTRGAVQPMSEPAETGVTLTIRRDPLTGGTLTGPAVQAVAAGGALAPVTVTPGSKKSVEGWYESGSETPLSSGNALPLTTLAADTVLTVRFTVEPIEITFDLGAFGHFTQDGNPSSVKVLALPGKAFPAVPPFAVDEAWHMLGWNVQLPLVVPEQPTTFTGRFVSSAVRIVHVTPEGAGRMDGSDWDNAYGDLRAAYADAGQYRGEVWMKEGKYVVNAYIPWVDNVTVRGGFAGTETDSSEADPSVRQTVITGDVNGNDYWKPDNADPSAANKVYTWTGDTFNRPPADETSATGWFPASGNDNPQNCFQCMNGNVTNSAFDGIVFTGFSVSALRVDNGVTGRLKVSRCRFWALNANNSNDYGPVFLKGTALELSDCDFVGGNRAVHVESNGVKLEGNRVADCTFSHLRSTSRSAGVYFNGSHDAIVANCVFTRCDTASESWRCSAAMTFVGSGGTVRVSDCLVSNCTARVNAHGTVIVDGSKVTFERLRVVGNRLYDTTDKNYHSAGLAVVSGTVLVRDSYFGDNSVSVSEKTTQANSSWGAAVGMNGGSLTLLNCTFRNNACSSASSAATVYTGIIAGNASNLALVNCLVTGSAFAGNNTAEFVNAGGASNNTLALVNSVVDSSAGGYVFYRGAAAIGFGLANSYVAGLDASVFTAPAYLLNVCTEPPLVDGRLRFAADGEVPQVGLSRRTPYRKAGCPVWIANDGAVYFYDETNGAKPYRQAVNKANVNATVAGISPDTPIVPDAFGAARRVRHVTLGPIAADPLGLTLIVR